MGKNEEKREKNWKHMYTRSDKLARSAQLGVEYPRVTEAELTHEAAIEQGLSNLNLLFICSRNQWRSPTAEQAFRKRPGLNVRSAGTSPRARRVVSMKDLQWADVVFVMEEKHKSRLLAEYQRVLQHKPLHVLEIPDEYKYMDPELIELLEVSVSSVLDPSGADEA